MIDKNFLTRSEYQVMLNLWALPTRGGFTRDILQGYDDPKPAYTTLATFLKILVRKGFVNVKKVGSMQYYIPKVSRTEYCKRVMRRSIEDYFAGDVAKFVEFLLKENQPSEEQKAAIAAML